MSLTTQAVSDAMKAIRAALPGALDTLRHDDTEYTGTAIPFERGEVVDESGAMFTITGASSTSASGTKKPDNSSAPQTTSIAFVSVMR